MEGNCLGGIKNWRSDEGRFGDYRRNDGLIGYSRLRGTKNEGRSDKMGRFDGHGRSRDLMRCNHLSEFKNWGRDSERGRVKGRLRNNDSVLIGLDGFGRCEHLLRRNELGHLWRYGASVDTTARFGCHGI